jgi:lipopolysaccharide export system permease protein
MAYLVPHYIALALPISLLIGLMSAFNRLSRDGEIDALQCAGVGLARLSRMAVVVSLGVAVVTGVTLGYLKPYGRYAYQAMIYTVTNAFLQAFVQAGVFTQIGDTTLLVHGFDRENRTFSRIFVYQDDNGRSAAITASEGMLTRPADGLPVLRLFDGIRLTGNHEKDARQPGGTANPAVGVLRFDQLRMSLSDARAPMFRPRGIDERELTIAELWDRRNAPPPDIRSSDVIAEFHMRLAQMLSVPLLPLLGVPLALGRRRSDRSWGIAAGLLVLILYNQLLDFGKNLVESGETGPLPGIWLPFVAFAALSCWLFWRASTQIPRAGGIPIPSWAPLSDLGNVIARWTKR